MDLLPLSSSEIRKFSTGEITRVGMAAYPELLIMDEPTLGLDPVGRSSTAKLITELGSRKEKTLFVSSHILADIDRFCTHIGIINNGKLVFKGTISEVKKLIRTNTVELHVEGDAASFVSQVRELPHVVNVEYSRHIIRVGIDDSAHYTGALLDIFQMLSRQDIELISFNSGSENLEEAFLRLLDSIVVLVLYCIVLLASIVVWFILIFVFVTTQWEFLYSPVEVLNNFALILEGTWDVDYWKILLVYGSSPFVFFGVSLLVFYQKDL